MVVRFTEASLRGWAYALGHVEEVAARLMRELPQVMPGAGSVRLQSPGKPMGPPSSRSPSRFWSGTSTPPAERARRRLDPAAGLALGRRDLVSEQFFFGILRLAAAAGPGRRQSSDTPPRRWPGNEPEHRAFVARRAAELRARISEGGLREPDLRAIIYARLPERIADERAFNLLRRMRAERGNLELAAFEELMCDQFLMVLLDHQAALARMPKLQGAPRRHRSATRSRACDGW